MGSRGKYCWPLWLCFSSFLGQRSVKVLNADHEIALLTTIKHGIKIWRERSEQFFRIDILTFFPLKIAFKWFVKGKKSWKWISKIWISCTFWKSGTILSAKIHTQKNKVQKLAKSFDGVAENRKSMGNSNFSNSDIGNRHFIIIFVL